MADLRKSVHGENSMKGVELAVVVYDNATWENKQGTKGSYVRPMIHPDDPRAVGQVSPDLRVTKQADGRYQHNMSLYESQMKSMAEAAGDNVAPLKDKDGNQVGSIYGVKADVTSTRDKEGNMYLVPNSKTFAASELSVAEVDGKSVVDRSFEGRAAARLARDAAKTADKQAEAPEAAAPEAAAPEADKPAVDPKRSAAAKKAAATRRAKAAAAAEAEAPQADNDQPGLG